MSKRLLSVLFLAFSLKAATQDSTLLPAPKQGRLFLVGATVVGGSALSFAVLNNAWYDEYARTKFHLFNDGREWLQMDKAGHVWSVYQLSRGTSRFAHWAGLGSRQAAWTGAASGMVYLLTIELLDAYSSKWGWSWWDIAANATGAAAFLGQELGWNEQRISIKFSTHYTSYPADLEPRARELFGKGVPERVLKDYNAQTYWLSLNPSAFGAKLPKWLNVAVGYGADGMWGGFDNRSDVDNGAAPFDRRDITRLRQWYLSPDIDFTRIDTNSKFLRTLFFMLNAIKFPAPALQLSGGKLSVKGIAF